MCLKNRCEWDKQSIAAITLCKELCYATQWSFLLCVRFTVCVYPPWLRAWDKHLDLIFGQMKWH